MKSFIPGNFNCLRPQLFNKLKCSSMSINSFSVGLFDYWGLDETSDNNRIGINLNELTPSSVLSAVGKIDNCADFSNNNNMLYLPASEAGIIDGDVTVAFWLMLEDLPAESYYFQLQEVIEAFGPVMTLSLVGTPRKFKFYINNKHLTSTDTIVIDTWYFIIIKKNSSGSISFKINDVAQTSLTAVGISQFANTDIAIGGARGIGSYNCKIDEFGIWSRLTTDIEDTTLYNSGNGFNPFA